MRVTAVAASSGAGAADCTRERGRHRAASGRNTERLRHGRGPLVEACGLEVTNASYGGRRCCTHWQACGGSQSQRADIEVNRFLSSHIRHRVGWSLHSAQPCGRAAVVARSPTPSLGRCPCPRRVRGGAGSLPPCCVSLWRRIG